RRRRIKIAIIDSGIDMKNKCIKGILGPEKARKHKRIEDKRSWVGAETNIVDTFGHGTAVAYLLLKVAPAADLYIARVSEGKTIPKENIDFIAKAIRHAAKQWDVDIISLSLGIDSLDSEIDEAIDEVTGPTDGSKPKIIFAAASNNRGGNSTRAYPASRRGVICIHASDGNGGRNDQLNPSVKTHDGNFTTLGIGIPFKWDDKDVLKSGTSFATPIAAGIAANMMEYTRHNIKLSARNMEDFYSPKGMVDLFQLLRQKKGDYGYIQPWFLWDNQSHNSDKVCKVLK
ncbi:peptidase S8/S53 domain-containing protein, partial [Bisporella sp. PMI_857]